MALEAASTADDSLDAAFDALVADLQRATSDRRTAGRLALVKQTIVLEVQGSEHLQCTLRFDESPEVVEGASGGRADVTVKLTAEAVHGFWSSPLPMRIYDGEVTFEGRVRGLLAVMPVLKAAARGGRDMRSEAGHGTPPEAA